jgi:lipoprotein NlpI
LGKAEVALRDADEALKLAHNNPALFACRGDVYFEVGEFDKSAADYSKAIALGAITANSFRSRGLASFYAGKLEDAAEDLTKASAAADSETQAYVDIWLIHTLQRLGRPLPDGLAKRAADAHGDWPRPALAMLVGKITPDEMLAMINAKNGDDRQMALAEAYFYLGQHYRAAGDEAKARAFFEKTRELGIIIFTEHIAAEFELRQMKVQAQAPKKSIAR